MVQNIYTMESCSSTKQNKVLPFATKWRKLEIPMLSEMSQSLKHKYDVFAMLGWSQYETEKSTSCDLIAVFSPSLCSCEIVLFLLTEYCICALNL